MRLIDANILLECLSRLEASGGHWLYRKACDEMIQGFFPKLINEQPTVDAVPVVHGRWLDNGMCNHKPSRFRNPDKWTIYKCSECRYSNGRRKNANYCPNCGAKMDGV